MVSFVNFARIASTRVGFHLGTLHEFPARTSNKTCLNMSTGCPKNCKQV